MRRIVLFLALAAAAVAAVLLLRARGNQRWNVVLVTLDTTRADFLGCYGYPGDPTPQLDALAREGVRFDQAIATASVTPVSHASILTGLDNHAHGVRVLSGLCGFRLGADIPSLSTVLRGAGWATAAVHSAFPVSAYFGFDRGFDVFESFSGGFRPGQAGNMTWDLPRLQRRSDETTTIVLDRLRETGRPFFLWVHMWDPHDNVLVPPPEYLPPSVPRLADGRLPASRELYAAEVSYVDHQLGRLFASLRENGEWERTLVVVVADHGEGLGDHGWQYHRILYQEQIRVPLLVRIPGPPNGREVPAVVRTTDIFPTVLDYLGVAAPRSVSGRSLRPLIEGRDDAPRTAFADQINGYDLNVAMLTPRPNDDFMYAVIDGGWKLVWRPLHPEHSELFHLDSDPRELVNRFDGEPGEVLRLQRLLARHGGWVTTPCHDVSEDAQLDAAAAARVLAELGYAGGGATIEARWGFACPGEPGRVVTDPAELDCPDGVLLVPAPDR